MTDLLYREEEDELRDSLRAMLAGRSPVDQVLANCEQGASHNAALWRVLARDMGLAGLAVPEQYGGAGASLREAAVVVEELGRAVAPVPYLGSAVVATTVARAVDDGELLAALGTGEAVAALAVPFATAPTAPTVPAGAAPSAGFRASGGVITGQATGVADALAADILLVPTAEGLFAVPMSAAGVERRAVLSLDLTRPLADVLLRDAPGRLVASGPRADQAVAAGLTAGAALLASEQLGIAEWCLATTVSYLTSRYQFGRPVGSFQALKHRLADVWVDITQARAAARYAAVCVADDDPDAAVATALAQAYCGPMAVHAAEECVQLHGGIGFTWEHPAHLFLKRAKADAIGFGTADRHRSALAELVDLPAAPAGSPAPTG
jgi:alkylation response protein AidB-like acyl-CoA dehydrogenase